MALRKVGKVYHILFRDLNSKVRTVSTGDRNKEDALKKEKVWMAALKAERQRRKRGFTFILPDQKPLPDHALAAMEGNNTKRLKLSDALDVYIRKYAESLPQNTRKIWNRFTAAAGVKYMNEVTPQIAYNYMDSHYSDRAGKTFNNNKNALNSIFKALLLEAGIHRSPFELVRSRKNDGQHQRPFTEDEFVRIYHTAEEPWKSACLIAWHTGFRRETVFNLRYEHIKNDIITIVPGKTARFGRAVRVPLHPQLKQHILGLPETFDGRVLGFDTRKVVGGAFNRYFGKLLNELDIKDSEDGIVCFNSIRNSFISRCRAAGIEDHAIRGMVGHTDSETTDLYSQEIASALPIKDFPALNLTP
ncbi:MAG: tyrosine-type recombinase/integrase [Victivallales bacterium]|nr:tyrosine-type recombinase/integrase [Victivallales bacterium]